MSTAAPDRPLLPLPVLALIGLLLGLVLCWAVTGADLAAALARPLGIRNDDSLQAVYLHDQVHRAVVAGDATLSDPLQFWPEGSHPTGTHGANVLEMLVSGVARLFVGWPAWWSLGVLVWIPLNLLAALPLGQALWPRRPGVTLGVAAAWALSPVLLGQLVAGRLTQVAVVGLPLAVLGLLRVAERGGRRSVVLLAAGMALTGVGYWFYAVFLAFCAPVFWLHGARQRGWRPVLADLVRAALGSAVLVLPVVALALWERHGHGLTPTTPLSAEFTSPDFSDALRLSGGQVQHVRGWMPLGVALGMALGLWRAQRRGLWLGAWALCTVMALGPGQHLGDHLWLLPNYLLWRFVPGMDTLSHPERWLVPGALFALLLAGGGLARLGRRGWLGAAGAAGLVAGVAHAGHEAGHLPLPSFALRVPAVWQDLAQDTPGATVPGVDSPPAAAVQPGAVVVLPLGAAQNACVYQPFLPRPMLGGMVENLPWYRPDGFVDRVNASPLLRSLAALSAGQDQPVAVWQEDLDALHDQGVAVVVWDRALWRAHHPAARLDPRRRLTAALGPPAFSDDSGAWWTLPTTGRPGTPVVSSGFSFGEKGPPGPDPKAAR